MHTLVQDWRVISQLNCSHTMSKVTIVLLDQTVSQSSAARVQSISPASAIPIIEFRKSPARYFSSLKEHTTGLKWRAI